MVTTKDEAPNELADWHFGVGLNLGILAENEDEPGERIKPLEVNAAAVATGAVLEGDYVGKTALKQLIRFSGKLAPEIEKLAPAIAGETGPANAEYPWKRDGSVIVPCDFGFPSLARLIESGGRTFLKPVSRALDDFESVIFGRASSRKATRALSARALAQQASNNTRARCSSHRRRARRSQT
jgi:hypothetical protein